ncbi:MAG: 3' terminal RNA ribose 2'-O-methyltransferase Hen1 [Bacteroidota bacterium]
MLLHLSVRSENAPHLGYLLGKHPDKYQTKELSFGHAHVFFPEATSTSCSACLLLDIDTTAEMRQNRHDHNGRNANVKAGLDHYVNDRAYVASSFLCTAISKVFGSALNGNCTAMPALVNQTWKIEAKISAVCVRGGAELLHSIFEPLGYGIKHQTALLDTEYPEWGASPYYTITLSGKKTVQELLQHLYILLPILDNRKHYYFKESEIEKLLAKASAWLPEHPAKELIVRRYFGKKTSYRKVLAAANNEAPLVAAQSEATATNLTLHQQRHEAVIETLIRLDAKSVLDLGCSTGRLLERLLKERQFTRLTGVDVATKVLQIAAQKLGLRSQTSASTDSRLNLIQGALTYQDDRFQGYDAALLVEVIEHLDPERLPALEQVVFRYAAPPYVIVTTPNIAYNSLFPGLPDGQLRHPDHRFEWNRATFQSWAERIGATYGYNFECSGIGLPHETLGTPSQMVVFSKKTA